MNERASDLSAIVKRRRQRLGLRQDELAELACCSPRFVHTVEAGKQTLRLDKLLDVMRVLGLDLVVRRGQGRITVDDGSP